MMGADPEASKPRATVTNPMFKEVAESTIASLITPEQLGQSPLAATSAPPSNTSEEDDLMRDARRFAATGNRQMAKSFAQRAVDTFAAKKQEWVGGAAAACAELAYILNGLGEAQAARRAAGRACTIWERSKPPRTDTEEYRACVAQLLHAAVHLRNEGEVLKNCRKGREMLKVHGWEGVQGPGMCTLINEMAEAYRFLRNLSEAAKMATAALALSRKLYGPTHRNTATAMVRMVNTLVCKLELEAQRSSLSPVEKQAAYATLLREVGPLSTEAIQIYKLCDGPSHVSTLSHKARHARLLTLQGEYNEAAALFEEVSMFLTSSAMANTAAHAHILANQAQNLLKVGELERAPLVAGQAMHIMRRQPKAFPGNVPDEYYKNFERNLKDAQPRKGGLSRSDAAKLKYAAS